MESIVKNDTVYDGELVETIIGGERVASLQFGRPLTPRRQLRSHRGTYDIELEVKSCGIITALRRGKLAVELPFEGEINFVDGDSVHLGVFRELMENGTEFEIGYDSRKVVGCIVTSVDGTLVKFKARSVLDARAEEDDETE